MTFFEKYFNRKLISFNIIKKGNVKYERLPY